MTSSTAGKSASNITVTHDADTFCFTVQQKDYPEFVVIEGYMQRLVDAYLKPSEIEPNVSLWNTFHVTEDKRSLILERSSKGQPELLMKLSKTAAKRWAEEIETTHGHVIRAYAR